MQPGLNLNNLKYFYDAVESESISEAARRNFISQSAVSQGIMKLEKALNMSLISHQRNCFKLTPEGKIIFSLTQQIFSSLKAMTDASQEVQEEVSGEVSIVCTQSVATNIISSLLQKIKTDYPKVNLKMKIAKMENICLMLKRGLMDMGIVVDSDLCDQFDKEVLRKGVFQLYSKSGKKEDINQGIYVDHINGVYVNKLCELYQEKFNISLKIKQELDSWQVLAKCAENDIGWCFLPDFVLAEPLIHPLDGLPIIPYQIVSITPKGVHLSRAAKLIRQLIVE